MSQSGVDCDLMHQAKLAIENGQGDRNRMQMDRVIGRAEQQLARGLPTAQTHVQANNVLFCVLCDILWVLAIEVFVFFLVAFFNTTRKQMSHIGPCDCFWELRFFNITRKQSEDDGMQIQRDADSPRSRARTTRGIKKTCKARWKILFYGSNNASTIDKIDGKQKSHQNDKWQWMR